MKNKKNPVYRVNGKSLKKSGNICFSSDEHEYTYYIVENVNFANGVYLNASKDTCVIFRNCSFHVNVNIHSFGDVVFENNIYYNDSKYPTLLKTFFNCRSRSLRFTNELFMNSSNKNKNPMNTFGMNIESKCLMFDETFIKNMDDSEIINIESEESIFFNSCIEYPTINIKSKDIYADYCSVTAKYFILMENQNIDNIDNFYSPNFIYNKTEVDVKRKTLRHS